MAHYDVRELQLRLLKIMDAVDQCCRTHGLTYYLWAGSMLGAARHQGFIPWDDDMDIAMPRPDFEKLMKHQSEWLPEPFEAHWAGNDPTYPGGFAKIIDASTTLVERKGFDTLGGIYIDVFPLDGVPENWLSQRLTFIKNSLLRQAVFLTFRDPYRHGRGPKSWVPLILQKFGSRQGFNDSLRRVMKKVPYDQARLIADYDDGIRGVQPKEWTGQGKEIAFEGRKYMGVAQPELYLANKYGPDFMTPPPADKQRMHRFYILDYNTPYREYKPLKQS